MFNKAYHPCCMSTLDKLKGTAPIMRLDTYIQLLVFVLCLAEKMPTKTQKTVCITLFYHITSLNATQFKMPENLCKINEYSKAVCYISLNGMQYKMPANLGKN